MKKKLLEKKLRELGAIKIRDGRNHEIWSYKNGRKFSLGRHPDVPEPTARAILKKAKKN